MSRPTSLDGIRSVLIVKPSSLGDIVHTLPAVHLLKRAKPALKIHWVVNTEWVPLLEGNPDLDCIIPFPRKAFRLRPRLGKVRGWLAATLNQKPDLALDFQGLLRSALIARTSGARAIHCLGDAEIFCRMLAHRIVPADRSAEHAIQRYLRLVADLGVDTTQPLESPMPAGEPLTGVDLPERYLLLHPFSRGTNKSLSDACVAELCRLLAPLPVVLVGSGSPGHETPQGTINLLNKTSLAQLIWLIRHAHFTVSVDSGPMHIAAAITDRLLGIHNWTDPFLVGPGNPGAWVWKNAHIFQMRDLKPENRQGALNFGPEHVPQLVEFLKKRLL